MQQMEKIPGLTLAQVTEFRRQYGWNKLDINEDHALLQSLKRAFKEPMLILLMVASTIYFITGAYAEGVFMVSAIIAVFFISQYQESRSKNALAALKAYSQPKAKVIREGATTEVLTEEVVQGDHFVVEEGQVIPADGVIVRSNDFSLDESILTGESLPVAKSIRENNLVYRGTLVSSGLAICKVTAVGMQTRVGQIGKSLQQIKEEKSPLQIQIENFVTRMAVVGAVVFLIVWIINYLKSSSLLDSLLKALTLAMSILPEEIPVAFATFMALGAWRLVQVGVIVKQTKTVETLGSATVICVDKTGTLTKNEMALANVYDFSTDTIYEPDEFQKAQSVISTAMWASEPIAYDPMEMALHKVYEQTHAVDERQTTKMIHEYPLSGLPPVMTHVFQDHKGNRIIAAKGGPEAFIRLCDLNSVETEVFMKAIDEMAGKGFRVLGVAEAVFPEKQLPSEQHQFHFRLKGLVGFYDPPKENISSVLDSFYHAGIQVKLITGDNTLTAQTIARQINFRSSEAFITGEQLMQLPKDQLREKVNTVNIFTRMFPEAKLKVIEALKEQKHIVAMTGDGVNDGPALKAAHIGIAMGLKGSEVAKEASALVLSKDDLNGMVQAVFLGRRIYNNLKKAIQYIISIHIPAILIVFLPLVFAWPYPAVFTPVHIIFLELIMGPTCSIIYENEPIEQNLMTEKPRAFSKTFFRIDELLTSIVQGLAITCGLIASYWFAISSGASLGTVTSMTFVTLIAANIFLTLINRSFYYSVLTTMKYKNPLMPLIISLTIALMISIFLIPTVRSFFGFVLLDKRELIFSTLSGAFSVLWFEVYKWRRRMASSPHKG